MRVLLAFDKFKGSMTAGQACAAAREVLQQRHGDWQIDEAPLTDGGEGFVQILTHCLGGYTEPRKVTGPLWQPKEALIGWVQLAAVPVSAKSRLDVPDTGKLAIIEMAQAAGFLDVPADQRNPWHTTTYGVGELIRYAVESGASAILVGIGGSATNDAGAGALEALGMKAYDRELQPVTHLSPDQWKRINSLGGLVNYRDQFPPIRIACDVRNPLTGERGATSVFGPQKGLQPDDQPSLERQMDKMGRRLLGLFGHPLSTHEERLNEPGAGAAGGLGFGLRTAFPQARFVEGFPLVAELLSLHDKLAAADLVLTGEGRFDSSSLDGKGPLSVLTAARKDARKLLLCGGLDPAAVEQAAQTLPGLEAVALTPDDWPIERRLAEGEEALRKQLAALD
ncbi:MAG: glycerate kinase [Verrucomicrobiota bacterium JB022]|nr:glycerate kinase [Verrucomicrobiota bacterium JB022]